MMALTFMTLVAGLGIVVALSLPEVDLTLPSAYVIGGQVAAGVVLFLLCSSIGFRVAPIAPGTAPEKARAEALQKHQTSMILRLVLSELIALVSLALAFVLTEGQLMTYVIGGLISLALMAFFAYPSARNVRRVETVLDSAGTPSRLAEALGVGDDPTSTHRVL
jgi:Ca2+/Na+ antiporter